MLCFVLLFDPQMGRPSTPMENYLRLMFLKFCYRLGYDPDLVRSRPFVPSTDGSRQGHR
jgi:hypothetical protein